MENKTPLGKGPFTGKGSLFIFLGLSLLLFATFLDKGWTRELFDKESFYIIVLVCVYWGYALYDLWRHAEFPWLKVLHSAVVSLVLCSVVFFAIPPTMKFFNDEVDYLRTSRAMFEDRAVCSPTEGFWEGGRFVVVQKNCLRRGLLFPFLTQGIHQATGRFAVQHAFALNFLVLFGLVFLLHYYASLKMGPYYGLSVVFLMLAHPVVTQTATCGLVDLLEVFLLMLGLFTVMRYLEKPSRSYFRFLFATLVLLAYNRYESMMYFLIVGAGLALLSREARTELRTSLGCALTPLLLAPVFWQRGLMTSDYFVLMQKHYGDSILTVSNFLYSIGPLFRSFFLHDTQRSFCTPVNMAGLIALCFLMFYFFQRRRQMSAGLWQGILVALAVVMAKAVLITAFLKNSLIDITQARFFILFCVLFSFVLVVALSRIRFFEKRPWAILLGAALVFTGTFSGHLHQNYEKRLFRTRQYYETMGLVKELGKDVLVVTRNPVPFWLHDRSAISFVSFKKDPERFLNKAQKRVVSNILVVQEADKKTRKPDRATALDGKLRLKLQKEAPYRKGRLTRFSLIALADGRLADGAGLKKNMVIKHPDIDHPKSLAFSPDGKSVFVNNLYGLNTVVLDAESMKVVKTIRYDGWPCEMAVMKDGSFWVSLVALEPRHDHVPFLEGEKGWDLYDKPSVVVLVDPAKPEGENVLQRIEVGVRPKVLALSEDEKYLFVVNNNSDTVSVVDIRQGSVTRTIPVGLHPRGMAVVGARLYVANRGNQNLSVIDIGSLEVVDTISKVPSPRHVLRTADGQYLFVSSIRNPGLINKVRLLDHKITASVKLGDNTRTIALSPDGKLIYAVNFRSNDVSVVDTATMSEIARMPTGRRPVGIVVSPSGDQVWVACFGSSSIAVYDVVSGEAQKKM